jgi:N-acetyl-anhydromuramyl-L-alanine amidase AmpD
MNIQWKPVINKWNGRYGHRPEAIVIHIAEGYLNGAYSWFNNSNSQASSHYMTGRNGEIWQFVADEDTAWHAGGPANPSWNLLKPGVNPNLYTIGIEHEGFTGETFSENAYYATIELIAHLCQKWNIPIDHDHIIGHYRINSVSRSRCPGTGVNFDRLVNQALTFYEDPNVIKELQAQVASLQNEISGLKNQITNSKTQIDSLNTQINQIIAINQGLELDKKNLLDRVRYLESNTQETERNKILREQVEQLSREVQSLQRQNSDLVTRLNNQNSTPTNPDLKNQSFNDLFGAIIDKVFKPKS